MSQLTFPDLRTTEFPWTRDHIYLNAASIGPVPVRTRRAVEAFGRRRSEPYGLADPELMAILDRAREVAARLINAESGEIALATNTSFGLNVAATALPIAAGDVVVVSEREFPANVYPWLALRERGVRVELVPTTAQGWPDEDRLLERVADPAVKVLALSHVQFATGYRADLDRIGAECRANGAYFVVDAIQALGQIPLDVKRTPVDVLACGAQKWLLSPWGSAFAYVRRELIAEMRPPFAGWMAFEGTDDFSRLTEYGGAFLGSARRFEVGTIPFQDMVGMAESLALLLELGVDRVRGYLEKILAPMRDGAGRGLFELTSPVDATHCSAITCIRVPHVEDVFQRIKAAGVACSLREGSIRISPHCYNTVEELERVAALVG
jgi:selenocysteine lyase/cysteine desulfurase